MYNVTITKKAERSAKTMPAITKGFGTYTTTFLALLKTRR